MNQYKRDIVKTAWWACAIAGIFTDAGVLCLIPAAVITAFAFLD